MQHGGINLYQNLIESSFDEAFQQFPIAYQQTTKPLSSSLTFAASDNDAEFEGLPDVEDELDSEDDDDDDDEGTKSI